ncbi:MAG: ATP-binding protein [Polyangiaceae bacterium]|jgi:DNA replication protein DnaC|nr:ATP-binding protein [Polyangiaceae bacterium]
MLNEPTIDKMRELRLAGMLDAWQRQQQDAQLSSLSFDERLAMLIDAEHDIRHNRKLGRLLKEAELRIPNASIEDVRTSPTRGIDKPMQRQLASATWLQNHINVLICGQTGVGKSYLACALGQMACRRGHRVLYRRVPRLFDELALSRADGTIARVLGRLGRAELLVLDDFGISPLKDPHRTDLLEVLEDRYGRTSTVITSQLPLEKWHAYIGDPTVADAILDRVVHNAYRVQLKGPSGRKGEAVMEDSKT